MYKKINSNSQRKEKNKVMIKIWLKFYIIYIIYKKA